MKLIIAFLRLVRWPNLVIIALTQMLFYVSLIEPFYRNRKDIYSSFTEEHFLLLIISSVLIAAAGNIINDYFDLNIDEINKPHKKIIDKMIKRRWAIVLHILFSFAGIVLGFYVDFRTPVFWLGFSNLVCAFLLFAYSISLKKKLLVGNIIISLLTAWVILVCFFCFYRCFGCYRCDPTEWNAQLRRFIRISFLYAGFAFIISLIREVVKDMEDMDGDAKYGCRTMPIAWGIPVTKVFVAVWLIVLAGSVTILAFYLAFLGWYVATAYSLLFILLPLMWIMNKLLKASSVKDYHRLSSGIKLVMLTGTLSMLFFRFYS